MSFQGKTAVITGASSGIGLLCAQCFAEQGANIVMLATNPTKLQSKVDALTAKGYHAIGIPTDVRNYAQVADAFQKAKEAFSTIDIVINSAGGSEIRICGVERGTPFQDVPIEVFDWGLDVNLKGPFYMGHAAMKYMAEQKGGVIINIGSMDDAERAEGYRNQMEDLLAAGCTIQIGDFRDAVVKACNDEKGSTFTAVPGSFTLGVSAISNSTESVSAADSEDGNAMVKMYTEFGAAAVGSDGKILAALTDAIQPKITVSAEGEIVSKDYTATKRELGDDYNMVKYGNAIAEWDAQAKAFADYTVGKTADEVMGLDTTTNAEGYQVSTDETLLASCTMAIDGMQAAIATAVNNAR